MSYFDGVKFLYRSSNLVFSVIIIIIDLICWGLAGLLYYSFVFGIESWPAQATFSLAWKGMFYPIPFVVGHFIGLVFYLSARVVRKSKGIMKKTLVEE